MSKYKKLNIMVVPTGGFGMDGITSCIMNYYNNIERSNVEFTFVVTQIIGDINYFENLKKIIVSNGDKVVEINRKKNPIKYFLEIITIMNSQKFDAVHIHGSSSLMAIELLAAKISNISIRITHSHNTTCNYKRVNKLLRPALLKLTTCRVACGQDAGEWLFGKKNFLILKNGIDISKYSYNDQERKKMRESLQLRGKKVIGHIGTFNTQKNQEFFVGILKELVKKDNNYCLIFVGDGEKKQEVKEKFIAEGLEENVLFLGRRSDVHNILQAMDLMVLPSLHEGFPLVAVECQASGLRCILSENITNEAKLTELVYFMSLQDSNIKWAEKIEKVINYQRNNCYNNEILKKGYDVTTNAEELVKIYTKNY